MKEFSEEIVEKIDLYVSNRMDAVEQTSFEALMASDPGLKQEVDMQKDIVNSIKNKHVHRIKTKLNSIDVSLTPALLQTNWLVTYGAIALIGIGSFVAYSYYSNDDNPFEAAHTVAEKGEHVNFYSEESENVETGAETPEKVMDKSIAIMKDRRVEEGAKINEVKSGTKDDVDNDGKDRTTSTPVSVDDKDVEEDFSKSDVEVVKNPMTKTSANSSDVDVNIKPTKGKRVEYQFYDDKLYLYGNFNPEEPYVIYDIPTNYGTEYYFKIANKYYKLEPNQVERRELEAITNTELIKELDKK